MGSKLTKLIGLCLDKNIPFVSYCIPGSEEIITWVQRSGKMLFLENLSGAMDASGFIYAPFHRRTNFPVVVFEPEFIFRGEEIDDKVMSDIEQSIPLYAGFKVDRPYQAGQEEYLEQAEKMIRAFGQGLSKVVLSRVILVKKPGNFEAGGFFLRLARAYPDAFCHLIHIPGAGCWTGASPEMLFRSNGSDVHTVALAGTRKYTGTMEVTWGEKEVIEQEMVSRHIESVMSQSGVSAYRKEPTQTVKAGTVLHLATRYAFSEAPDQFNKEKFIHLLHPTPAVGGLPNDLALDLITETEKHNREYYAGYCGPVNINGNTDLFVNLRCMKVLPDELAVFTGGGLTAGSHPIREWEETEWKAKTLLSLI